jgi:hypothetical protein
MYLFTMNCCLTGAARHAPACGVALAAHGCCSDGRAAAGSATASSCSAGACLCRSPSAPVAAAPPLAPAATLLGGLAPVLPPAVFNLQEWATSLESGLERNEFCCEHNLLVIFSWRLVAPAVVEKLVPQYSLSETRSASEFNKLLSYVFPSPPTPGFQC